MDTPKLTADDIHGALALVAAQPYEPRRLIVSPRLNRWMEQHRRPGEHDAELIARMIASCDACLIDGRDCPGRRAHCADGDHCDAHEHVCAIDIGRDDHEPAGACCHCGAARPRRAG